MKSHAFRTAAVATAIISLLGITAPAEAKPGAAPAIPLNTGQEVGPVHTGAGGSFTYTIDDDELCYTLTVRDLSAPAMAAHIHLASRNVAGGVVIPLEVDSGTDWTIDTCTTEDSAVLAAIESNPGDYYVNVHNADFPGGEVRGQLK
ncbi:MULTISPECIES: CHRD domain-containing protein [unclassified Pseudarthrobacter]|uniref:CHRD domain-containing protein n=1 Tax=unclassified Pseudarthrobacter TaxID=2647000 RepID=UPI0011301998|nr:CHRD domain-containing protein [Pseudarthrobacter sp. NIBRBAC000502772]QDG66202.1 CHRD domain-containing protein [Pseudarthrobacter sp. NIBRBAC000502772]